MKKTDNLFTKYFINSLTEAVTDMAPVQDAPLSDNVQGGPAPVDNGTGLDSVEGADTFAGGTPEVGGDDPSMMANAAAAQDIGEMEDPFSNVSTSISQWYAKGPDGRESGKLCEIEAQLRELDQMVQQPAFSGILDPTSVSKVLSAISQLESDIINKTASVIAQKREALAKNTAEREAIIGSATF